ncbi:ribosomal protein S18-alanine N-acetyltransferase [Sphingomonas immobilis]|uniref:Ribosomal protein S18-alanine N-acetyltransferase n=1 Tax=Sphingomonas immobilis TaxID=3063997 RepID=A0ABT9A2W6_9SPHN|nr:ribosomal protein S18-alanine N-acetyltransferase [Sphingomonas sp. CA1-15]MDO7843336.1 ribosomal protein S18-alanine N-acetyltransferase [Sphingomonas sp. CA1-15]
MSTILNVVDLRSGAAADLGIVDTIMQSAFDTRFGEAWTRTQCLGILAMPGVWLTIAAANGEDAGFALSRIIADEAELLLLATTPAARRRGIGAALLRSVITDAKGRGARTIHLEVRENNGAIKLYQSAGFTKVGERRQYYRGSNGQTFDAFTFRRELA